MYPYVYMEVMHTLLGIKYWTYEVNGPQSVTYAILLLLIQLLI